MSLTDLSSGEFVQFACQLRLAADDFNCTLKGLDGAHGRRKYYFGCYPTTTNVVGSITTILVASAAMADLAENLKKRRIAAGLTQTQLATLAGVSQQLIDKLENRRALESRKLTKIAKALGVTAEELMADADKEQSRARTGGQWPFEIPYERFAKLPEREQLKVEGVIENAVREFERSSYGAQFKIAPKKRRRA